MDATINFMDGDFSLVHIPIELFPLCLKPIIQLILPREEQPQDGDSDIGADYSTISTTEKDLFTNISITPLECSVVCKTDLADRFFAPFVGNLPESLKEKIVISAGSYNLFNITAHTIETGKRIVEVTAPLAIAGIPIFYLTSYYNDSVLFPKKGRKNVVEALLDTGFKFEQPTLYGNRGPEEQRARRMSNVGRVKNTVFSTRELERLTLDILNANDVRAFVVDVKTDDEDQDALMVACVSGQDGRNRPKGAGDGNMKGAHANVTNEDITHHNHDWLKHIDKRFYLSLVNVLTLGPIPKFFSLTITDENPPSLIIDVELLHHFGSSLRGQRGDTLVPIFLNLANLPTDTAGIVCGVGGIIAREGNKEKWDCTTMTFLSTAQSGCVLISDDVSKHAMFAILDVAGNDDDEKNRGHKDGDSELKSSPLQMKDLSSPLKEMHASVSEVGPMDIPAPKYKRPYD